jgi:hypothetical protein
MPSRFGGEEGKPLVDVAAVPGVEPAPDYVDVLVRHRPLSIALRYRAQNSRSA